LWMLTDLVVTGRPLFSWTYTTGEAEILGRQRTPAEVPHAVLSALDELLKWPVLVLAALGMALALHERRGLRLRVPLALVGIGVLTFVLIVLGGVSGQVPRYASVAAVGLLLFTGYLFARLLRVPSGTGARLAWVATIALIIGGAAWTASRLHPQSITGLLRFRHAVETDLRATLRSPTVTQGRRCGAVGLATHKLVPAGSWALDAPPGAVAARADPRRGALGVVVLELGTRLLTDPGYGPFTRNSGDNGLKSQVPPVGFARRGRSRYFAVYVRC
jgi:hypothetical protein